MNRLKQIRKERNVSQQELAEKINVSVKTISRWESVEFPNIKPDKAKMLADFFEVPTAYLLGLSDIRYSPLVVNSIKLKLENALSATPENFSKQIDNFIDNVLLTEYVGDVFFSLKDLIFKIRRRFNSVQMTDIEEQRVRRLLAEISAFEKELKTSSVHLEDILNSKNTPDN